MTQLFAFLTPELVWGLFPRLLALIFVIALVSLYPQVIAMSGANGIRPVALQLRKIREDYPSWRRFFYFPTLLWINASDRMLVGLVIVGIIAGVLAIIGGAWSVLCLGICWICFLSLDLAMLLIFPWDCLLLEAGFLALFLSPVPILPTVEASVLPLPIVAFALRFLLFRLMFGFGKYKFIGTNLKERLYLKNFMVNQPIPNPIGYWASRLPDWIFVAGLIYLFYAEMISAFLIFFGGDLQIIAALSIIALMIGIQGAGNFGHFNVLVICLSLVLFDTRALPIDPSAGLVSHLVVGSLIIGGLIYLPFNSWVSRSWVYWPSVVKARVRPIRWIAALFRWIAPFRILHAYGVFPPAASPAIRWTAVFEGSHDGQTWRRYCYRYLPSDPDSSPKVIAPFHPRLDHSVFYQGFGVDPSHYYGSLLSIGNPYYFAHRTDFHALAQRLIEGSPTVINLFADNPFPDSPPRYVRVNTYALSRTTPEERRASGHYWHMELVAPHMPTVQHDPSIFSDLFSDPELFLWDEITWRERSPRLRRMMQATAIGDRSASQVLLAHSGDLTPADLDQFWNAFLPHIGAPDWSKLPVLLNTLEAQFDQSARRKCELIFARLSLILWARIEPYFVGDRAPLLKIESYFHLGLLLNTIIGKGRESVESVFARPAEIVQHRATNEHGLFYIAVFRPDKLAYHSRKLRMSATFGIVPYMKGLPGFAETAAFLQKQYQSEPENIPKFIRRITNGEWIRVE